MSAQELSFRSLHLHNKEVKTTQGIKFTTQTLENAMTGTQLLVIQKGATVEDLMA